MDRISRSARLNILRKPIECFCSLLKPGVLEIEGREIVVSSCHNNVCGCKWRGELNHYLLYHRKRCNFQVVQCHCKEEMYKGQLGNHLTSECINRLVDYSKVEDDDDLYGMQNCPRSCDGCKWFGTCKRYEQIHANQCNYQDVICYCNKHITKWALPEHVMTDCDLQSAVAPETIFSTIFKQEPADIYETVFKDKAVQ